MMQPASIMKCVFCGEQGTHECPGGSCLRLFYFRTAPLGPMGPWDISPGKVDANHFNDKDWHKL